MAALRPDADPTLLRRGWWIGVAVAYLLLSVTATWPLARDMRSRIASDPGDPPLNASILRWNATTMPFTAAWWTPPHHYPATGAWIVIDLGAVRDVGGVTHGLGDGFLDFPRRLAIDVSGDRQAWERVWEGSAAAPTFLAFVREPRRAGLRFTFTPRAARFVRLVELDASRALWRVSGFQVHAPVAQ